MKYVINEEVIVQWLFHHRDLTTIALLDSQRRLNVDLIVFESIMSLFAGETWHIVAMVYCPVLLIRHTFLILIAC